MRKILSCQETRVVASHILRKKEMEGDGQTVRVCGLPTDIEEEKLTDKLYIHFLRQRNGGGEIAIVVISKVHPGCALITFEDSKVAQRVVQHGKHILLVDNEKYELSVSLFKRNVNRDEVLVQLQLTVNYSQLPLGKGTVTHLQKGFPNVELKFNPEKELCTLSGSYSEVQALINQILGLLETQAPGDTSVLGTDGQVSKKNPDSKGKHQHRSSKSQEKSTQPGKALDLNVGISGEAKSERLYYSGLEQDDYGVRAAHTEEPSLEDYSLVLDSDIFRYLQQFCGEEYMQILKQHRVEVVDVTTQDVTTLYLRALEGAKGGSRKQLDRIQQVHGELSQLYQEKEIKLRKEQLPKRCLLTTDLRATCKALQLLMPKLMLTDDETYIYLVGSSSDVSEAKQHLLYIRDSEEGFKQKTANYTQSGEQEVRDIRLFTSTPKTLDSSEDKLYKGTRAVGAEAGRQYMLAANFKEVKNETAGENWVKSSLDDTFSHVDTQRDFSSPNIKQMTSNEQRLGGRVHDGGGLRKLPILQGLSDPGQSKLFKRTDSASASTSEVSSLRTLVPTSAVLPNKAKYFMGSPSTLQSDLFQEKSLFNTVAPSPKLGAQSTLRRSNSFSGLVRSQQDEKERDASKGNQSKSKTGTTGVNDSIGRWGIYSLEVPVSKDTWIYMKDMYHTWVEDIKSSVNIKEAKSADLFTLVLSGTDPEKLSNCQQEVKKQVSAVSADFTVQELSLTKLGAKDLNITLEICCTELRRKFHKVKIVQNPETIHLSGPKQLCDEVHLNIIEALSNAKKRKMSKEVEIFGVDANHTNLAPSQTQHSPPQEQIEFHKDQEIPYKSGRLINGSLLRDSTSSSNTLDSEGTQREDGSVPSRLGKNNIQTCDLATSRGEGNQSVMKQDSGLKHMGRYGKTGRASFSTDTPQTPLIEGSQIAVAQSGPKVLSSSAYKTQKVLGPKEKNTQANALNNHTCLDPEDQKNPLWEHSKQKDPKTLRRTHEEIQTQEYESKTCACGTNEGPVIRLACGFPFCSKCPVESHYTCKVCHKGREVSGIRGKIRFHEMSFTLPGHPKDMTLKITYIIPNGIQGEKHPNPGAPFEGGTFEAYLPLNDQVQRLRPLLEKAFYRDLTFTVSGEGEVGQVIWGSIPHKTSMELKSKNGYPDSSYLRKLSEVLTALDLEDGRESTRRHEKNKT
ncbi:uncharacterized protein [Paramormyrops kingsleyae]|uniref:uncharacterized protein isoform X2 n=1 Tax=Paramormyrops kingsleyae TaxID=1676925 RepID=UPI003B96F550